MNDCVRVETPLGAIIARPSNDPDNPGIWIDLRRPNADCDLELALVEFSAGEEGLPEGEGHIITRVWGGGNPAKCMEQVVHRGIEDYFRQEDIASPPSPATADTGSIPPTEKNEYIVLCYPTQAIGMRVDLGNGPMTENGDRTSQYFKIAKGRKHMDRAVSVALIENISGLPEDKRYYTFHLIDDVSGAPCKLYHTSDLSEDSLVGTLKEILDSLEGGSNEVSYTEIRHDHMFGPAVEPGCHSPEGDGLFAGVAIDGWETDNDSEMGCVIAQVLMSVHGDLIVAWHDNGARMDDNVLIAIDNAKQDLLELWAQKGNVVQKGKTQMKYKVRISELRYGEVTVEAEDEERAISIAAGKEIEWFDSETTDMTAERID